MKKISAITSFLGCLIFTVVIFDSWMRYGFPIFLSDEFLITSGVLILILSTLYNTVSSNFDFGNYKEKRDVKKRNKLLELQIQERKLQKELERLKND